MKLKLVLLLMLMLALSVAAETGVEESPRPSLNVEATPRAEFSEDRDIEYGLTVTGGDVQSVHVAVKVLQLKAPDGLNLPPEQGALAVVVPAAIDVPPAGVSIPIQVKAGQFKRAGDYKLLLLLTFAVPPAKPATPAAPVPPPAATPPPSTQSKSKATPPPPSAPLPATPVPAPPATQLVTIVLHRTDVTLNLDDQKDLVLVLKRSNPFGSVSGRRTVCITASGGLQDVTVAGAEIVAETSHELNAQALVANWKQGPSGGKLRNLDLQVDQMGEVGSYTSRVTFTGPGLTAQKSLALKITVTDAPLFPLIVIFFGVLGGYIVHQLSEVWRPRKINEMQLLRLQNDLDRALRSAQSAANRQTLAGLRRQLRDAREANDDGKGDDAAKTMKEVGTALDTFFKDQADLKEKVRIRLMKWNEAVGNFAQEIEADAQPGETALVQARSANSEQVQTYLASSAADAADEEMTVLEQQLSTLWDARTGHVLDAMRTALGRVDLATAGDAKKKAAEELVTALQTARTDLQAGKGDDVRKRLPELRDQLEDLAPRAHGARAMFARLQCAAPVRGPRISTNVPVPLRNTDLPIAFVIEGLPEAYRQAPVDWKFAPGSVAYSQTPTIEHLFSLAGDYVVTARLHAVAGAPAPRIESLSLTVLEPPVEIQIARTRRKLLAANRVLSGLALVVAAFTGLQAIDNAAVFGTLPDYLKAFLWGFGVDTGLRGFAAVFKQFDKPSS